MNDVLRIPDASRRTRYKQPLRGPRYRPQRYVVRAKDFMSTATVNTAGALTPFAVVAREAELEVWALEKLLPDGWAAMVVVREGVTYVTPEGVAALAAVMERRGYAVRAHSLRVLARQQRETPSRGLLGPVGKNEVVKHAWQERADLA